MKCRVLVIGYGNELRRDDAVGPQTARAAAQLEIPGLRAVAVHQLTPELAEMLAYAARVVFVDADRNGDGSVRSCPLEPTNISSSLGHLSDPRELLALAEALYGRSLNAWLITVPAPDLDFGEGLSASAERGLIAALQQIALIARDSSTMTREGEQCTRPA